MTWEFRSRRWLGAIASAALLSVALPMASASAQKVKTPKPETTAETGSESETPPEITVEIADIEAENSSLDGEAIRAILTGHVADYADELATLDADRIHIPQITMTISGDESGSFAYNDIALTNVVDGVAGEVSVGGITVDGAEGTTGEFGALTAADFDIGAALAFYGLVDAAEDDTFKTVYRDLNFEGGTIGSDEFECTLGTISAAEFQARPLRTSFAEFMALAAEMEAAEDDTAPDPATLAEFFSIYADFVTAFKSSPVSFDGLDCAGTDDDGGDVTVAIGAMNIEGFEPGLYPAITVDDWTISIADGAETGTVTLGQFVFKGFDYSPQVELFESFSAENADDAWFEENWRQLLPGFAGFSLADLDIDIPIPEEDGADRLDLSIAALDLSLGNYVNGIPADISSSADNLVFTLPEDGGDEQIEMIRALGIETLDLGYDLALSWDETAETIAIETLAIEGADLGSIAASGTVFNAVADLFSADESVSTAAAMDLAVTDLSIDVSDNGIVDLLMTIAGAEQNASAEQMRPIMAGVAEGMALGLLGGGEMATQVGGALGAFLRGNDNLSVTIKSKDEAGIGMADFMAAEQDPAVLIDKVTIDATSE